MYIVLRVWLVDSRSSDARVTMSTKQYVHKQVCASLRLKHHTPSVDRDVKPLVESLEMISRGLTRTQTLLENSRVASPVFGAVIQSHVWTVQRQPQAPPDAVSSIL